MGVSGLLALVIALDLRRLIGLTRLLKNLRGRLTPFFLLSLKGLVTLLMARLTVVLNLERNRCPTGDLTRFVANLKTFLCIDIFVLPFLGRQSCCSFLAPTPRKVFF